MICMLKDQKKHSLQWDYRYIRSMKISCILLFSLVVNSAQAQMYDNNWIMGYEYSVSATGRDDRTCMSFDHGLNIAPFTTRMNFCEGNGTMSDENGVLMFYTNGDWIADSTGDTMQNGAGLEVRDFYATYTWGSPLLQSILVLPKPYTYNHYIIFYMSGDCDSSSTCSPWKLMFAEVDMSLNHGLGAVIQKNIVLINDWLTMSMLTACKHGNGNDWWIFVPRQGTNIYHRLLFTSNGVVGDTIQFGRVYTSTSWNGRAEFSPNGEWYCRYDQTTGMSLKRFDRCLGTFSSETYMSASNFPDGGGNVGGVAFSSNSNLMYITSGWEVNQLNLLAANIPLSKQRVSIVDTFNCPFPVNQTTPELAPDGKIYIIASTGILCMSVINNPDSIGIACNVQKHNILLPTATGRTIPNNPNYRLGAITCAVTIDEIISRDFHVYPNPTSDLLFINFNSQLILNHITIFDLMGKILKSYNAIERSIDISDLSSGSYIIKVNVEGRLFYQKFVKL